MSMNHDHDIHGGAAQGWRRMSDHDFANYGVQHMAYVRLSTDEDGNEAWTIHAADGTPMGASNSRDSALAAVRQHDMEPLSVH